MIKDTWIPYELNPNTSIKGEKLSNKFSSEKMKEMKEELNKKAEELDIEFLELETTSNSHNAFKVAEWAKIANKFHAFHKRVYEANFREGQNLHDRELLAILGEDAGLNKKDVYNAIDSIKYEEKLREYVLETDIKEIDITPTFIINDEEVVAGSQPLDFFREKFDKIK